MEEALGFASLCVTEKEESVIKCVDSSGAKITLSQGTVKKIPYLNTLLLGSFARLAYTSDAETILPECIKNDYLEPIVSYVETDDEIYLVSKLRKHDNLGTLVELLDFLGISTLQIYSLDIIAQNLKDDIQDYTEKIARKVYEFHKAGGRKVARTAAANFCIGLHLEKFNMSEPTVRQKIYNLSLFVQSHSRTFKERCRLHLWKLMQERCSWFTAKQWKSFEPWVRFADSEEDTTDIAETDDLTVDKLFDSDLDCYCYFSD
jgi:hypothetical protein